MLLLLLSMLLLLIRLRLIGATSKWMAVQNRLGRDRSRMWKVWPATTGMMMMMTSA